MRPPYRALAVFALFLYANLAVAGGRASESERLSEEAAERWEKATLEQRHKAIEALEQAAKLAPGDLRVRSQLAHAYLDAGYNHDAKELFEHLAEQWPDSADAWEGLGRVWKRDWLATLAPESRHKAVSYLERAVRADPSHAPSWTLLAVLRMEQGDVRGAGLAAEAALAASPESTDVRLVNAYVAYRTGRLASAESLFAATIPRMPRSLAVRFRDISPLLPPQDGEELQQLSPAEHAEQVRRFWSVTDPDPTTRVNEARLEYWSRIAHASLLFSDRWDPIWDMRAEFYVRYGAPGSVAYQPPGTSLARLHNMNSLRFGYSDPLNGSRRPGDAESMWYPRHVQVWFYPDLGMLFTLEDPALSQHYQLPRNEFVEMDPAPDPAQLARSGLLATGGGRGVFAPLPPGEHRLPIEAAVSAFQGDHGPRLLANVAAPGAPGRALHAECVVLDSTEHEVARMARELGASRCDAATTRAGDFAFDLPPGSYRVAVSVADGAGGRGVVREHHELSPLPGALALSDIVLVCGPLETLPVGGSVRLDPNLERRIGGREPLLAYFEVYALRPDARGGTTFEYEYKVHSLERDPRPWFKRMFSRSGVEPISVRSPEEGAGPTRRQYLSVPAQSLPPGRYRLEVTVKDHGATARREVEFEKVPASAEDAVGAR
jgi:GWxTD domain-containing protein